MPNNFIINNENIVVYYNGFTVIRVLSDYSYNTQFGTNTGMFNNSISYGNTVVEIQAYRDTINTGNTLNQEVGVDSLAIIKYKGGIIMERTLRGVAGFFILASLLLAHYVSPLWLWFTAFVGFNLFQSAFTNWCLMYVILHKLGIKDDGRSCFR